MEKNTRASLEAEKDFWADPKNYTHFSRAYWEEELKRDGISFSFFQNKVVCEIGCGPFGMLYYADAKRRIGIDPLISYYKDIGLLPHSQVRDMILICGEGDDLCEVASDSVDVVICYNVLDHTRDPKKVLSEASRILRDDGVLYLNCHTVRRFLIPFRKILRLFDPPHPHHFSVKELRSLVNDTAFIVLKEKLYSTTPSLDSLKAIAGRLALLHHSIIATKTKA